MHRVEVCLPLTTFIVEAINHFIFMFVYLMDVLQPRTTTRCGRRQFLQPRFVPKLYCKSKSDGKYSAQSYSAVSVYLWCMNTTQWLYKVNVLKHKRVHSQAALSTKQLRLLHPSESLRLVSRKLCS